MALFKQKTYTKHNIINDGNSILIHIITTYNAFAFRAELETILNDTINKNAPEDRLYTKKEKKDILAEVDYELRSYFDH